MKHINVVVVVVFLMFAISVEQICGHGMMLDPVGRSSRWRYDNTAPKNYDDNGLWCGGFGVQWYSNNGKCGLCGDDYALPTPRPNELGGVYGGSGVITKTYTNTHTINVGVQITANHLGYIYFNLCNLDKHGSESEECFSENLLKLADGSDKNYIGSTTGWIDSTVVLPNGLSCNHCVLRWTYRAGNNWGSCGDGTGALGCGPQEHFMSCADVSIVAAGNRQFALDEQPELPPNNELDDRF